MLVLTRKSEEQIVIGDKENKIVITILRIQGDKVSIGIQADRKLFPVYRSELLDSSRNNTEETHSHEKEETEDLNQQVELMNLSQ